MTVNAADFYFQPTCVQAASGDTLTLRVTNTGAILHNVTIADQGIDIDVAVGETIEVPVTIGDGPLVYICKFHRTLRHGRGSATGRGLRCARRMTP